MVELYVVRHGETDTNHEGRINGHATNLDLNTQGVQQVKDLDEHVNINYFDEVYSSPLKRAIQTAEILNHGVHQIIIDDRLSEINYGSWDGLKMIETKRKYPDAFDENAYVLPNYTKYAIGGEENEHVYSRVKDFIKDMSNKGDKKILIVCHGFISRSFCKVITGIPNISDIVQPDNAGVSKYRISSSGHAYLVYYDCVNDMHSVVRANDIHSL
ncbi:histidine phosphatase family protein [Companilactobacillus huachuanensis]|uniref:Histidine phosphatase family protein n=1 Tax=Companilactobacillus huachuanensis TaxID=2559914 RepID=A0ABW1RQG7_9LACO|nr:histidine phosphatase family protein [Companilactobacillus huachuanensis]